MAGHGNKFGEFITKAITYREVPGTSYNFEVLNEIVYRDPGGTLWASPPGLITNGASVPLDIPGFPRFGARYRKAVAIHDHFCTTMSRPAGATHLAFYNAMRAEGFDPLRSNIAYFFVYRFGPWWENHRKNRLVCKGMLSQHGAIPIQRLYAFCNDRSREKTQVRATWRSEASRQDAAQLLRAIQAKQPQQHIYELAKSQMLNNTEFGRRASKLGMF